MGGWARLPAEYSTKHSENGGHKDQEGEIHAYFPDELHFLIRVDECELVDVSEEEGVEKLVVFGGLEDESCY